MRTMSRLYGVLWLRFLTRLGSTGILTAHFLEELRDLSIEGDASALRTKA